MQITADFGDQFWALLALRRADHDAARAARDAERDAEEWDAERSEEEGLAATIDDDQRILTAGAECRGAASLWVEAGTMLAAALGEREGLPADGWASERDAAGLLGAALMSVSRWEEGGGGGRRRVEW